MNKKIEAFKTILGARLADALRSELANVIETRGQTRDQRQLLRDAMRELFGAAGAKDFSPEFMGAGIRTRTEPAERPAPAKASRYRCEGCGKGSERSDDDFARCAKCKREYCEQCLFDMAARNCRASSFRRIQEARNYRASTWMHRADDAGLETPGLCTKCVDDGG